MIPLRLAGRGGTVDHRRRPPVVLPAAAATLALLMSLALGVPERTVALRIWLVAIGIVAVRSLLAVVRDRPLAGRHDTFDAVAARTLPPPPAQPAGLKEAAWLVKLASGSAADLHFRVRPVLREVAAQRLGTGHGLDLDDDRDLPAAAARCGPVLWELVRPGRPAPEDRTGPALDPDVVADVVRALEAL